MRITFAFLLISVLAMSGCKISFTGADTSGAKTVSVKYFKSLAPSAGPLQSQQFTEALKDLLLAQSSLDLVENEGDLHFEGAIVNYDVSPVGLSAEQTTAVNRLTLRVKVKYVNSIEPEKSFERDFSQFSDFEADQLLIAIEADLLADINELLTQDIFNASLGNW